MDAINDAPLNLSAASAAALADLTGSATPPTAEATPVVEVEAPATPAEEVEATPSPEEPTLQAEGQEEVTEEEEEPTITPPPPEEVKKWSVKARGKTLELSEAELLQRASMGIDYETKTQRLAAQAKQVEQVATALQQREQVLLDALTNPAKLEALRQQVQEHLGIPSDPSEVLTAEQAATLVHKQLQGMEQRVMAQQMALEQERQALQFEREVETLQETYERDLRAHVVGDIMKAFPVLDAIDDLETVLKLDVARAVNGEFPDDITRVKALLTQAAEKRAGKLTAKLDTHKKMEAVRAAKLTKPATRIEPPGGGGVRPTPSTQSMKLGDPQLTAAAVADLAAAFAAKK
jgi:hypothetical protein